MNAETKKPRLFYFAEDCEAWVPAPDRIENIMDWQDWPDRERVEVSFLCVHLDDQEYENLPEV